MDPAFLIPLILFAGFLLVLAVLAFVAFRVAAKREGPGLGAAGGCALAAVLLGAALFAFLGLAVIGGLWFAAKYEQEHAEEAQPFEYQLDSADEPAETHDDFEPAPGEPVDGEVRQY